MPAEEKKPQHQAGTLAGSTEHGHAKGRAETDAPAPANGSPRDTSPGSGSAEVTRTAGRGGLAVAFAKVYFILQGLIQQVALPRVLGLDGYGALSSVLSIASITYNPVVTTSIQGVSRAVAQARDEEQPAAIRRTVTIHTALTIPLALGFFLLAGPIGRAIGGPHLVPALRIISGVMLFYGLYTPLIGVVNGQKRFLYQAGFDIVFATVRTAGLIAGGWWFATRYSRGVEGSTWGFVAASLMILIAALAIVGVGRAGPGGPTLRQHLAFIAPLLVGQTLLNLLLQADLTLLRRFAADAAVAAGQPMTAADPLVGAYRATQLFCFLPYQLLIAVTFIIFPLLATAHRDGNRVAVAGYVRTGVRLALVLAGAMVSVTSGLSGPLLLLVFPPEAAELGTRSMQLLTLGFGAFAIFGILTTVLNSLKRERSSALITTIAFTLVVVLCFARVRGGPFGPELLWRTALATSIGIALATLGAGYLVRRTAGAVVSPLCVVRVAAAMAICIAVARHLPYGGKVMTVAYSGAVGLIYLLVLIVTREVGKQDLGTLKTVMTRSRAR